MYHYLVPDKSGIPTGGGGPRGSGPHPWNIKAGLLEYFDKILMLRFKNSINKKKIQGHAPDSLTWYLSRLAAPPPSPVQTQVTLPALYITLPLYMCIVTFVAQTKRLLKGR